MGIVTLIVLTLVYALAICLTTTVAGEPLLLSFWNHGPMYTGSLTATPGRTERRPSGEKSSRVFEI